MTPSFGALPSKPDYRDYRSAAFAPAIPLSVNTDVSTISITNQGALGICTSNLAYIMEYLFWKKTGTYVRLSRRFLYTMTKVAVANDSFEGAQLRDVLKAAQKYGVCTEATYPSDTTGVPHEKYIDVKDIPVKAFEEAQQYRIGAYYFISPDQFSIAEALTKYGVLYCRYEVDKNWWTAKDGRYSYLASDLEPLRPPSGSSNGHATVLSGYDFSDGAEFRLMNSWGNTWCEGGLCTHSLDEMPTEVWGVTLDKVPNDLPAAKDFKYTFTKSMTRGSSGKEVLNLQIALMIAGDIEFVQPADRGYFGAKTQKAVYDFQRRVGISSPFFGLYCGPQTIKALNNIYSK